MNQWQERMQHIVNDLENGDVEHALKKMVECETLAAGSEQRLLELTELYFQLGHQRPAKRLADHVLEINHNDVRALLIKGEIAFQQEQWDEAITSLEKAHDIHPKHPEVLVALADGYREMGMPEVALTYLERLVDLDPSSPYFLLALGLTQLETGQARSAVQTLSRAYERDDRDVDILEGLTKALIEVGEWEEALFYLTEALGQIPDHTEIHTELAFTRAVLHYRIGETEEAADQLHRLANKEPENIHILIQLGEVEMVLGRLTEAKKTWETVHQLDPLNEDALLALGRIALSEQEWTVALGYFREAVAIGDERDDVLIGIAEAYQGMGEWQQAIHCYEKIGRQDGRTPPPAGIYREMAHCYLALDDQDAAITCLEKELLTTEDTNLHNELADVYWQTGRQKEACECWQQSLKVDPNQWEITELYERNCLF